MPRFFRASLKMRELVRVIARPLLIVTTTGMNPRLFFPGLAACVLTAACVPGSRAADYGTKAVFRKEAPIKYPDFTLTYVGDRHVAIDKYPHGFDYRDFRVAGAGGSQTVSWTSGTGEIGPMVFRVGGKEYWLELVRSDKLGVLKRDEVVISRAP
jgi:hypothetical protein